MQISREIFYIYLSICLSIHSIIYLLSIYLATCPFYMYLSIHSSIYLSTTHLSIHYSSIYPSLHLYIHYSSIYPLLIYLSTTHLYIHHFIYLSIHYSSIYPLLIYLSITSSIYLSIRIPPNLRVVVYPAAIAYGGEEEWEFLWQRYVNTSDPYEKILCLFGLSHSNEPWILSRYTYIYLCTHIYLSNIYLSDYLFIYLSI